MTSLRKRDAARANARASTGPRSARGKSRSRGNARRHGLSIPVLSDPALSAEAEQLAQLLAGDNAPAGILAPARQIAEAHLDLRRVRDASRQMLASIMGGFPSISKKRSSLKRAPDFDALLGLRPCLANLRRYERRALSRRKSTIRALVLARFQSSRSVR
jgi:hypothetical protein